MKSNFTPPGVESGCEGSSTAIPSDFESQNETQPDPSIVPLTSRHTSRVWKDYVRRRVGIGQVWEEIKAECNYCQRHFVEGRGAGTTHLKDHTLICPKRVCRDLRQTRLFGSQSDLNNKSETLTLAPYEFCQEDGRHDVAEMIILHEYAISMVEHYGFRKLCKTLQPGFKVPSRNTIKNDIMKRYANEKGNMMKLLTKTKSRIALTTDMWTASNQRKGYMAVTGHFIDNTWKLQSCILRFLYVEAPHTKEVLAEALCNCIYDWNLDCCISSITLDNCTTNDAVMEILRSKLPKNSLILSGKFLHMRCCAHILNLIVQDGLNVIGEGIERVRNSVIFWTASVLRKTKFESTARNHNTNCSKKLVIDCKTRWNSTYEMLKVAIEYKNVFDVLSGRESDVYKNAPLKEDWEKAEKICEKLELFSDITHEFSATKYPTANIYFTNICEIKCQLNIWLTSSDPLIKGMAVTMLEKYNKYWSDANTLLAVAAVLDPRYKLPLIRYYYKKLYEDKDYEAELAVMRVKDVLKNLVSEYSLTIGKNKEKESGNNQMPPPSSTRSGNGKLSGFAKYLEVEENQVEDKSELEKYLESPNVPLSVSDDFNILAWWRTNGSTFPILQEIARDILCIPVSSVASESAFSTGGRVLSAHRSRLLPSTVEALMCSQSWIWTNIKGSRELKEVECQQIMDEIEEEECISVADEVIEINGD